MDIKRYLTRINQDQFETLHPQRVSEWIDRTKGSSLHFTDFVQRKIGTAVMMEPGSHSSRIGILVSKSNAHQGLSNLLPRHNTPPL
jgi:hypothetical protein